MLLLTGIINKQCIASNLKCSTKYIIYTCVLQNNVIYSTTFSLCIPATAVLCFRVRLTHKKHTIKKKTELSWIPTLLYLLIK